MRRLQNAPHCLARTRHNLFFSKENTTPGITKEPERIRLWKEGVRDLVMELCCALHNFRVRLTPCNQWFNRDKLTSFLRGNPARLMRCFRRTLSNLRKDTKLYLTLSLNYRIDFSDLRYIAALKSVGNVFSFPCSDHHVTNRIGVTGRSACRCITFILCTEEHRQGAQGALPGMVCKALG